MKIWHKIQSFCLIWIILATLVALAIAEFRFTGSKEQSSTAKAVRTEHYTGLLSGLDKNELAAVVAYEPMVYRTRDAVGIMAALDCYDATFAKAAEIYKLDKNLLKAFCFIESGGYAHAKSPADCDGIAQFCARTARATGLTVSHESNEIYRNFRAAKDARTREIRRQKLMLADERHDPIKAIHAQAAHVATLKKSLGGMDFAIAAYHMGSPRFFEARSYYEKSQGHPKLVRWHNLVQASSDDKRKQLHELLHHTLRDDSRNYYYKVQAAYQLIFLAETNYPAFEAKYAFYNDPKLRGKYYSAPNSVNAIYVTETMTKSSIACRSHFFGEIVFNRTLWIATFLIVLLTPLAWRFVRPFMFP